MRRWTRHDLSYLVSAGLFLAALAAIGTGLVADWWDLNNFVYHVWAGYALSALALAHVLIVGRRLWAYACWRLGRRRLRRVSAPVAPTIAAWGGSGRWSFSRRGFLQFATGAAAGLVVGRVLTPTTNLPEDGDVGALYHQWSKPGWSGLLGAVTNWSLQPPAFKEYPGAPRVPLPAVADQNPLTTEAALRTRRSHRDFASRPLSLETLSRLMFYSGGINTQQWGLGLRAAPSAGALYPIETYVIAHRVTDLPAGLYHYAVRPHALEQLRAGDLRSNVLHLGLGQEFLAQAGVVIVYTAIFQRLRWRYRERSYRYALLETGHLAQNVYLAATALNLGACAVGAFLDDDLNVLLGVDGRDEAALYLMAVGER
jgi:SagB-type dehydrogenase family enzyme